MSGVSKENSTKGSENRVNNERHDSDLETPCPVCGHYGKYCKFGKFELLDHLVKKHPKKMLASFLAVEAYSSRLWDMDEETCKRRYHNSNIDVLIKIFERLKHKSSV